MITLDGRTGEGGGQILRTALGLALVTGQPFRIEHIRGGRRKPGLLRQHLTAVQAAQRLGCAEVRGAELGSQELDFRPGTLVAGEHHFAIGSAGSTTLVLAAVLPALLAAPGPTTLVLEGGTHNPWAPPFPFLAHSLLPLLAEMGADVRVELERPGFHPAGGGRLRVEAEPTRALAPLELVQRGAPVQRRARAAVAHVPSGVARRELDVLGRRLGIDEARRETVAVHDSQGPGNVCWVELEFARVTGVFSAVGAPGRRAERVAREVADDARTWLGAEVPVDERLADQLLVPLALAGGGVFRTTRPSAHTITNAEVIQTFLPVEVDVRAEDDERAWRIALRG